MHYTVSWYLHLNIYIVYHFKYSFLYIIMSCYVAFIKTMQKKVG